MKKSPLLLCLLFCSSLLHAQNLAGNYLLKGSDGDLKLELENNIGGVQGSMRDAEGFTYQLQAEVENGIAFGTISNERGSMFLRAVRRGAQLYLSLFPVGTNGQADAANAQEFILTALDKNGRPLSPMQEVRPYNYDQPPPAPVQKVPVPSPDDWNGFYSGRFMDIPSTMDLQLDGSQLTGQIDVNGYSYQLTGTVTGHQTRGRLLDLQTQTYFNFIANLDGKQINLNIENPVNGSSQLVIFKRGTGTTLNSAPPYNVRPGDDFSRLPVERDPQLMGHWNYTERFSVDNYSYTKYWKFILNPDGTYIYGDAGIIGNGPGNSGRAYGGDVIQGRWRTTNNTIWVNSGTGWDAYARYNSDGQTIVMEFGDGSRQSWYRSN